MLNGCVAIQAKLLSTVVHTWLFADVSLRAGHPGWGSGHEARNCQELLAGAWGATRSVVRSSP